MQVEQSTKARCPWATDELYRKYHDEEWGVPSHDDRHLFEMLILEGAQAGLSWSTILKKREHYREAFDQFDPMKVAKYGDARFEQLMSNPGIVRNRLKISAAIGNARAFLEIEKEFGSFNAYIWEFTGRKTIQNARASMKDVPPKTQESDRVSKDLLDRGFKFVGSTICQAFMQAVGMVNDHLTSCYRWKELKDQ